MGKELKSGKMVPNTQENGKITKHTARANSGMSMAITMKGAGKMTRQMDKAHS